MRRRLAVPLAVLTLAAAGCRRPEPPPTEEPPAAADAAAAAFPDPGPAGVALTPDAASRWRLREVDGLPPYFDAAGWGPGDSIWGIARGVPLLADGLGGGVRPLPGTAWGAVPSPDGRRLAWTNERGLFLAGGGARPALLIHGMDAHPHSDGGPPSELLWSPAGDRLLAGWGLEWDAVHSLVAVPDGAVRHLRVRIEGYFLREPRLWLDGERVLFVTRAVRSTTGEDRYGAGFRTDLAVLDLAGDYRLVTAVPDGVFLDVQGRLPDGGILVSEQDAEARVVRHWVYDPATWRARAFRAPPGRLIPAPAGQRVLVIRDLGVDRVEEGGGRYGMFLVEDRESRVFGGVRGDVVRAFWTRDGRRLALAADDRVFVLEERVAEARTATALPPPR
jgi:hypothetical protein